MSKYHLSETAKEDLYRIYKYGLKRFGMKQADLYYLAFLSNLSRSRVNHSYFRKLPKFVNVIADAHVAKTAFITS